MCCSLEKGIEELRELEIAIHSTTQMSSQQVVNIRGVITLLFT